MSALFLVLFLVLGLPSYRQSRLPTVLCSETNLLDSIRGTGYVRDFVYGTVRSNRTPIE